MGLFSALFGQSGRANLAKELAVARVAGLNLDEIDEHTQLALMRKIESMGQQEAMSLPEATIVTIVSTYAELIQQRRTHAEALRAIESHRKSLGSDERSLASMSLDDYVAYRLTLELADGPSPGMHDYWFNMCMSESCKQFKLPWRGGPTRAPSISRRPK